MTDTANLGLPCIEGNQAQKHVTHNDALRILDTLVQLAVLDRDLPTPPGSPAEGQRWIVKAAGTGAWAGHNNAIAAWQDGAWQFSAPQLGWVAFVADEGTLVVWNGSAWGDFFSTVTSLQNLSMLGVGTTADSTNRISAKLNNALWAAQTVAEGGDGNLLYKMSKESTAKTVSLLMQENYSGRAEIGLTGDDDFHFKVSPDGTTWFEGIKIAAATGRVTFPNTTLSAGRETLTANRTYYVRTDGSDANNGLANTSGGAFLTIQKAIDTAKQHDLCGFAVTIQVATGTYTVGINVTAPFLGGDVTVQGDITTPSNVIISVSGTHCVQVSSKAALTLGGFKLVSSSGHGIFATADAVVTVSGKMEFGACSSGNHLNAMTSVINVGADYTISGSAANHVYAADGGIINDYLRTVTITGTPAFSGSFAQGTRLGIILMFSNTFSGSATGSRYNVNNNAVMYTAGATLPGNAVGTTSFGGQYN
ncbi:MAG TPA: DUF2793 domain-containing protein [Pseudolabrys sp.]|jgi:hypothetical protein